jgi:hypothetical protein
VCFYIEFRVITRKNKGIYAKKFGKIKLKKACYGPLKKLNPPTNGNPFKKKKSREIVKKK